MVFFKLQLILFFEGLRSERQLMRRGRRPLNLRWYLGYDLDEPLPDHSSLTKIRERYGLDIFRRFFDLVVERCRAAGLVWGEELFFDATKVAANAARASLVPALRRSRRTCRDLFAARRGGRCRRPGARPRPGRGGCCQPRRRSPSPGRRRCWTRWRRRTRSATLDRRNGGRSSASVCRGSYARKADFVVSTTDPDATLMKAAGQCTPLGYHDHYVVDGGKARIILNALVTPADVHGERADARPAPAGPLPLALRPRPSWATPPTARSRTSARWRRQGIRAYVPLPDFDARTPYFGEQRLPLR